MSQFILERIVSNCSFAIHRYFLRRFFFVKKVKIGIQFMWTFFMVDFFPKLFLSHCVQTFAWLGNFQYALHVKVQWIQCYVVSTHVCYYIIIITFFNAKASLAFTYFLCLFFLCPFSKIVEKELLTGIESSIVEFRGRQEHYTTYICRCICIMVGFSIIITISMS